MNPSYATLTTYNEVDASDLSRTGFLSPPPPVFPFAVLGCLLFSLVDPQEVCGTVQLLNHDDRFYVHLSLVSVAGYRGFGLYFINDNDEKGDLIMALHQAKTSLMPPLVISEPVMSRFSFPFNQLTTEQLLGFVGRERVLVSVSAETGECCEGVLRRLW
ncbi:hypothetical protein EBZ80_02300 [bacterium]|nr:hypothetical protein [bacterium]